MTVHDAIQLMKRNGSRLAEAVAVGDMAPMTFACNFSAEGADPVEVAALWPECPDDLRQFWEEARCARLFEDERYGQWGLEVLDPGEATKATANCRATRERDFGNGDLVVGRFLGDWDFIKGHLQDTGPLTPDPAPAKGRGEKGRPSPSPLPTNLRPLPGEGTIQPIYPLPEGEGNNHAPTQPSSRGRGAVAFTPAPAYCSSMQ
jgi:hypothetical protein